MKKVFLFEDFFQKMYGYSEKNRKSGYIWPPSGGMRQMDFRVLFGMILEMNPDVSIRENFSDRFFPIWNTYLKFLQILSNIHWEE